MSLRGERHRHAGNVGHLSARELNSVLSVLTPHQRPPRSRGPPGAPRAQAMQRSLLAAAVLACCTLAAGETPVATPVKAKRKFCNSTLPGDYRYETCGEFCKSAKARNHCQYCKCQACTFCPAEAIAASKRKNAKAMKKKGPFAKEKASKTGAAVAGGEPPLKKKGKKGKGKKGGFKRRAKQIGQSDP